MKIFIYKIIFIIGLLFSCTTGPEGCGEGYSEINGKCYNDKDIDVLQSFIDNSIETIPIIWDLDSNGTIDPLEIQIQKWNENGRLTFLWLYDYNKNDKYLFSGNIPENIGNLDQLDTLNLGFNNFSGLIPEGLGNLEKLNWLYLYRNQLTGLIPDTICNIFLNLEHFLIYENQFCPPYPDCINIEKIGNQDSSLCLK